jgi:hypothetical protein
MGAFAARGVFDVENDIIVGPYAIDETMSGTKAKQI